MILNAGEKNIQKSLRKKIDDSIEVFVKRNLIMHLLCGLFPKIIQEKFIKTQKKFIQAFS